ARPEHHAVAVARAGMGGGAGEISTAIAAGGQNGAVGAEAMDRAVLERQRHDTPARLAFHDEVEGEIFDEELRRMPERLPIERVKHGVPGAIGAGAGALHRRARAEIHHHAAEWALIDLALFRAREGQPEMLELID